MVIAKFGDEIAIFGDKAASFGREELKDALDKISDIPDGSKFAIKDFIDNSIDAITEHINDLSLLDIPADILEAVPNILEILQSCINMLS